MPSQCGMPTFCVTHSVLPLDHQTEKPFFYRYFDKKNPSKNQKFPQICFTIYVKLSRVLYVKSAKENFLEVVRGTGSLRVDACISAEQKV